MVSVAEFQKTLYNVLKSNLTISIYDHRPKEPTYPYIRFNLTLTDISTKTEINYEIKLDILIFSTYNGNKEIYENINLIKLNLNDEKLSSLNNQCQVFHENTDIIDEDEDIKAGILNYKIILT